MNELEVLSAMRQAGAVKQGHFRLSSGFHSDTYVQCALVLQWPGLAERLGHDLAARFSDSGIQAVLGPAMGGLIIGHEVARHLGVRMVFSERVAGEMTLRRGFGFEPGERVLVAEDVVTTGRSQREAIDVIRVCGAEPAGVGSIINRSTDASFSVPFFSLARLAAASWDEAVCPRCAAGEDLTSPGSRYLSV